MLTFDKLLLPRAAAAAGPQVPVGMARAINNRHLRYCLAPLPGEGQGISILQHSGLLHYGLVIVSFGLLVVDCWVAQGLAVE